ncbi:Hpt domain-containing protein [Roseibium aggregatum]|uniref:Hpt domain-containing protein n=1 Tax=Roseibium aggregatum TaxID=187304 RepID=A0A926P101_9HYPH|nr:Hpt domain-containing protein [Roseibium aggregatum]MBD1547845.1 Hpt domain-containing protein [Roseibium aggregatum]
MTSSSRLQSRLHFQAPIDLVRLAANTLGNRDLEIQVLRLFVTQSSAALKRLSQEEDAGVLHDLVHTLKGSARAVGADAVANRCEELEHRPDADGTRDFSALFQAVDEANAYITDLLRD